MTLTFANLRSSFAVLAFGATAISSATVLSLTATADDTYQAFISTSPTSTGTLFLENPAGSNWESPENGSTVLTPGVINYLHIAATDVAGAPSMLLAEATLSDGAFAFSNGTGHLVTNDTDWDLSLVGFGGSPESVGDLGPNGSAAWGRLAAIGTEAHFIWSSPTAGSTHYFTVAITPVPEPSTFAALAVCGLGVLRRRRR